MCGRFTLKTDPETLTETFPEFEILDELSPHYNIAPTQQVAAVPNNGEHKVERFHWGLVPFWAKDPKIGNRMINARAETLSEKPAFRTSYKRRRCLILADGFYEWHREPGHSSKTPIYIQLRSEKPFAFAGLWEVWRPSDDDDPLLSCTIITTTPNSLMEKIHRRMPVILPPESYEQWLDPCQQPPDRLNELLTPYPPEEMVAYPVSRLVNSPQNDLPDCIRPVDSQITF
ncbi:MAG: SOS response-associated peptidase [Candidatus Poribacteria bacterium]|nr:SOS response-associated peptidase [Candidatus Poribacteria bacterium]